MNTKGLIAIGFLATSFIAGAAGAQTLTAPSATTVNQIGRPNTGYPYKNYNRGGERAAAQNINAVHVQLERLIISLQRDGRDFGGHKSQAIQLMEQARAQLMQAALYDRQHPGQ